MKTSWKTVVVSLLLSVFAALLVVYSYNPGKDVGNETNATSITDRPSVAERVLESGKIRVGYVPVPPSVIVDPNTKAISGIFPDTLMEVGRRMGLKIEWTEEVGWGTMIEGLESDRYDLVCTQVWPNATRAKRADFLAPLFYIGVGVYVRADEARFLDDLGKINNDSVRISVIDGEMSDIIAKTDYPDAVRVGLPQSTDASQVLLEVATGKADVTFMQTTIAERFLKKNPGAVKNIVPESPIRVFPNSMMIKRGEHDLKAMLNTAIEETINQSFVDALIDRYAEFPNSLYRRSAPYRSLK